MGFSSSYSFSFFHAFSNGRIQNLQGDGRSEMSEHNDRFINKIGIVLCSPREIDYYQNVIVQLDKNKYVFIISDEAKDSDIQLMLEYTRNNNHNYLMLNTVFKNKKKYKIILATRDIPPVRSWKYGWPNILQSLILYVYSKTIGTVLVKSGLSNILHKYFGRPFAGGGDKTILQIAPKSYSRWQYVLQLAPYTFVPWHSAAETLVLFPRGMDIGNSYPSKKDSKLFDYFFCHGEKDFLIVRRNTSKPAYIIGYPRYDNIEYAKSTAYQELLKEFNLNPKKELILWVPSLTSFTKNKDDNIKDWISPLKQLLCSYDIICRPHPSLIKFNKDLISALSNNGFFVDNIIHRSLVQLYGAASFVFADTGGPVFSALYCNCKIILLTSEGHKEYFRRNKIEKYIRNYIPCFFRDVNQNDECRLGEDIRKRLEDHVFWKKNSETINWIRGQVYGPPLEDPSSIRTAEKLSEMLNK